MRLLWKTNGELIYISGSTEINVNNDFVAKIEIETEIPLTAKEALFIAFENANDASVFTGALQMLKTGDAVHYLLIPDDIMASGGTWKIQAIKRRFSVPASETTAEDKYIEQSATCVDTFTISEGVTTKDRELVTAAQLQTLFDKVNEMLGSITGTAFEPVDELPPLEEAKSNVIYLVPIVEGETPNLYEEWIFVRGNWESLGTTAIDLSVLKDYVQKSSFDASNGLAVLSNNQVIISPPTQSLIDNRNDGRTVSSRRAVTLSMGDYFLKKSITSNTETLTDDEKAAALAWLGAVPFPPNRTGALIVYADGTTSTIATASAGIASAYDIARYSANGTLAVKEAARPEDAMNKGQVDALAKYYRHTITFNEVGVGAAEKASKIMLITKKSTAYTNLDMYDILGARNAYVYLTDSAAEEAAWCTIRSVSENLIGLHGLSSTPSLAGISLSSIRNGLTDDVVEE